MIEATVSKRECLGVIFTIFFGTLTIRRSNDFPKRWWAIHWILTSGLEEAYLKPWCSRARQSMWHHCPDDTRYLDTDDPLTVLRNWGTNYQLNGQVSTRFILPIFSHIWEHQADVSKLVNRLLNIKASLSLPRRWDRQVLPIRGFRPSICSWILSSQI